MKAPEISTTADGFQIQESTVASQAGHTGFVLRSVLGAIAVVCLIITAISVALGKIRTFHFNVFKTLYACLQNLSIEINFDEIDEEWIN